VLFLQTVLGKKVRRASKLDKSLCDELMSLSQSLDNPYSTHMGKTMCTDDFYEGELHKTQYFQKKCF